MTQSLRFPILRLSILVLFGAFGAAGCAKDATKSGGTVVKLSCNQPTNLCVEIVTTQAAVASESDDCATIGGTVAQGKTCASLSATHTGSPAGYVSGYCAINTTDRTYYAASRYNASLAESTCESISTRKWIP